MVHDNTINHAHVLGLISLQSRRYSQVVILLMWECEIDTEFSFSFILRFTKKYALSTCCTLKPHWNNYCWLCDRLMWIFTGVPRNCSAGTQCSTIDVTFGLRANTLHQNNLQDSHCLESMLVFWFFMKDTPLWTKTQWVIWTLTEGRWKMGRMEHPQRRVFITVSQPVVHCSCPSFLLLIVTLVFWPSTPKPAAWVIPDFLWHSSELSRGLD